MGIKLHVMNHRAVYHFQNSLQFLFATAEILVNNYQLKMGKCKHLEDVCSLIKIIIQSSLKRWQENVRSLVKPVINTLLSNASQLTVPKCNITLYQCGVASPPSSASPGGGQMPPRSGWYRGNQILGTDQNWHSTNVRVG